jgi:hypothetical protein
MWRATPPPNPPVQLSFDSEVFRLAVLLERLKIYCSRFPNTVPKKYVWTHWTVSNDNLESSVGVSCEFLRIRIQLFDSSGSGPYYRFLVEKWALNLSSYLKVNKHTVYFNEFIKLDWQHTQKRLKMQAESIFLLGFGSGPVPNVHARSRTDQIIHFFSLGRKLRVYVLHTRGHCRWSVI